MYQDAPQTRRPIGVLMIEHRTIEAALDRLEALIESPPEPPDAVALAELIDFFGTYADEVHHGKEEDILFMELDREKLDRQGLQLLEQLRLDHTQFREYRRDLDQANRRLVAGHRDAVDEIVGLAREFIPRLRQHIENEDKLFFPMADRLESDEERREMFHRFRDFDAEILHRTYTRRVKDDSR